MANDNVTVIIDGIAIDVAPGTAAVIKRLVQAQQDEQTAWVKQWLKIMSQRPTT